MNDHTAAGAAVIRKDDSLAAMAMRLYPTSEYLRDEWLRAVALVRTTTKGWVYDIDCRAPLQ